MTPETNSEGGYTLTKENLEALRGWLWLAKGGNNLAETINCIDDALAYLPKKHPSKEGGA